MNVSSNKIKEILKYYRSILQHNYSDQEADVLLYQLFEVYADIKKTDLILDPDKTISESELLKIHFAVKDLNNDKPIQYILGYTEFYNLKLKVSPAVLIPRPETEELVDMIVRSLKGKKPGTLLDIGTGSGCIAIVIKKYLPDLKVVAIDISNDALNVARENAHNHQTDIEFIQMDFLQSTNWAKFDKFDSIVSNPPYVCVQEKMIMHKNVLDYEPDLALYVSNEEPLIFYQRISKFVLDHLSPNGRLFCELNPLYSMDVKNLFETLQFRNIEVRKDLSGRYRFLILEG
jgi:release factor glutamine methyltransferase